MWAGFQGTGAKTIIPGHAHAKVSCRLVAAQDPDRVFAALKAFVEDIAPRTRPYRAWIGSAAATRTSARSTTRRCGPRRARSRRAFGRAPVYIREGGSIPVCASFEEKLGLPVVLMGFTQPDDHAHAPNEWMDLANYETGIRAVIRMWDEVAALDPASLR